MVVESPVLCCYWLWRGFGRSRVFACLVLDVQSTAEVWWFQAEEGKVRKCWDLQGQVAEETFLNLGFGCKYLS